MKSICINYITTQNIVLPSLVQTNYGRNITRKQLYEWLSKQDVYTSHHPILHHFARRWVITRGLNDVWDVDLMDMSNLAKYNDGVTFIAIFIDIFSRYLNVEPMKNKPTKETLQAIKKTVCKKSTATWNLLIRCGEGISWKRGKATPCRLWNLSTKNEKKANYAKWVIQTL